MRVETSDKSGKLTNCAILLRGVKHQLQVFQILNVVGKKTSRVISSAN